MLFLVRSLFSAFRPFPFFKQTCISFFTSSIVFCYFLILHSHYFKYIRNPLEICISFKLESFVHQSRSFVIRVEKCGARKRTSSATSQKGTQNFCSTDVLLIHGALKIHVILFFLRFVGRETLIHVSAD